ncbi:MAG: hypothetical protein AAF600_12450 [Bacteroidota bacterium]
MSTLDSLRNIHSLKEVPKEQIKWLLNKSKVVHIGKLIDNVDQNDQPSLLE